MDDRSHTAREHEDLLDRISVSDVLTRFACAIDSRDWVAYRSCFANRVEIDYRSLIGGDVLSESGDAWTERARQSFEGFEVTQHFISNPVCVVTDDRARCRAYICAEHFVGVAGAQESWTMGGLYDAKFGRGAPSWRIDALTLELRWSRGNSEIFELAAKNRQAG